MKKNCYVCFLGLVLSMTIMGCYFMPFEKSEFTKVSSTRNLFSYDKRNLPDLGTVYHYTKSNQNDSKMANVWIYLTSETHTESFKIYPGAKLQKATDLVIAEYDIDGFFTKELIGYLVSKTGERKSNAILSSTNGETYTVVYKDTNYTIEVGHLPTYNYNFDWCDCAFMYRHLIDKDSDFTIGVTAPDSSMTFIYSGKAEFKYIETKEYKNIDCRCYEVSGEAFDKEKGYMYTNKTTGALVEIDMPVRNNPSYSSFKFSLVDEQQMSQNEWDAFILEKTKEAL